MEVKRSPYLEEGKIILTKDSLIHNIITPELKELRKENQQLRQLCNKYKEKHKIVFQNWLNDRTELRQLRQQRDEAIEYIKHEWFIRIQLGITDKHFDEWQINK